MPTAVREGPYRFFFYSNEADEPAHVHIERDALSAEFWLEPEAALARSGFSPAETRAIGRIVDARGERLKEAWRDHFGD